MPGHVHDHDSGEVWCPVDEARERVLATIKPLQPLALPLTEAYGCVLAESPHGRARYPRFRVLRDGRVRRSLVGGRVATPSSPVELRIVGRSMIERRGTWAAARPSRSRPVRPFRRGGHDRPDRELRGRGPRARLRRFGAGQTHPSQRRGRSGGRDLVQAGRRLQAPELGLLATAASRIRSCTRARAWSRPATS